MITILDLIHWLPPARDFLPILLDAGLKSVAVLTVAGLAVACMKRRSAAARYLVCFLAVASLPVLPVLSWTLPGWRVLPAWMDLREPPRGSVSSTRSIPSALPTPSAPSTIPSGIPPSPRRFATVPRAIPEMAPPAQLPSAPVQIAAAPQPPPPRARLDGWRAGMLAWLAGVLLALAPVVLGVFSLHRLQRAARRETADSWLDLLRQLLTRLSFKRRVVLLKAARRRMPMTWGVLRPKVLLPEESQQWPEERRGVVLLHELAHAKRCDYLTHLVARLVCALYWFNPLVWLAARRMVAERERACDDIVLRHGAQPADYAEQVLEISAGLSTGWLAGSGGIAMARPSNLEGRLCAILDSRRNRAAVTRWAVLSALLLLTAILVPLAMLKAAPSPQPANPQSAPASPARIPKSPETVLAELRNILPEDWTCQLVLKPGAMNAPQEPAVDPLFRVDFTNLNIWLKKYQLPDGPDLPLHPSLRLYFLAAAEKARYQRGELNVYHRLVIAVGETPDYFVVTTPMDINDGRGSLILSRCIAPLGRSLEKYFGKFADEKTGEVLGLFEDALTADSGFAGEVVDDQIGKPVTEFTLEWGLADAKQPGGYGYQEANKFIYSYFGGRFASQFRKSDSGWVELIWYGVTLRWREFKTAWVAGQKVWPRIRADGYLPEPVTPEPVVWPVKLTNLMIRLKRAGASAQPAAQPANSKSEQSPTSNPQSLSSVALAKEDAIRNPQSDWGDPVEGVSAQLRTVKTFFELPQIPYFKARVRNNGTETLSVAQTQQPDELEVDGLWYSWSYGSSNAVTRVTRSPLAAGAEFGDIWVNAGLAWVQGLRPLVVGPGRHRFRFAVVVQRAESSRGADIRAVSNPVEVEVQWPPGTMATLAPQTNGAATVIVHGRVVDAESRQPIKSFTVTPGYAGGADPDLLLWAKAQTTHGQDGAYRVELGTDGSSALVLVEAGGYAPEMMTVGTNTIRDFALRKSNGLKGKLVDTNGQPVYAAEVAYGLQYGLLTLAAGNLRRNGIINNTYPHRSPITFSDREGNFSLPATAGAMTLVALHRELGFAQIPIEQAEKAAMIQLQPWTRVEGSLLLGGKPLTNEIIGLELKDPLVRGLILSEIEHRTTTDAAGRFVFEQLPPGDFILFRQLGGRYRAMGFRGDVPVMWDFVTNGQPIQQVRFPTSAIKTESGKTTTVELDAALQEPVSNESNAGTSSAHSPGSQAGEDAPSNPPSSARPTEGEQSAIRNPQSDASHARIPKSPETILAELRNILPEDWTCQLVLRPGEMEGSRGLVTNPLFRMDFTNLNFALEKGYYMGPAIIFPPHPYLRIYFLPLSEKAKFERGEKDIWNMNLMHFIRVGETPDYFAAASRSDINSGIVGAEMGRAIAPLGFALEKYFGKLADKDTGDVLGMTAESSEGLTTGSGFAGQVVDDQTGKPIREFSLEYVEADPMAAEPIRPNGPVYFGGRFMLQFRQTNSGWEEVEYYRGGSSSRGRTGWVTGQKVQPRIRADGYLAAPLTPEPVLWPVKLTNLIIRLKRAGASAQPAGQSINGRVLDDAGQPVAGAQVFHASEKGFSVANGKQYASMYGGGSTTTDGAGRFELPRMDGTLQRVVVVSPDGLLVWPALRGLPVWRTNTTAHQVLVTWPGQELDITLPKPGTLIVSYDGAGEAPEAQLHLAFATENKEMPLWTNLFLDRSLTVKNGGQIILTNLAPGTYHFQRMKALDGGPSKEGPVVGCSLEDIALESGQTQRVDVVRTNGQRICGKVIGLDQAKASGGLISVRSAEATGQTWLMYSRNSQKELTAPHFDVLKFGADGAFQTTMLKPGTYTVVAGVFPVRGSFEVPVFWNNNPDYMGAAKVTVTADAAPSVAIQLAPAKYVDITGSAIDDETGAPVTDFIIQNGTVNPKNPDEIRWNEGYQGNIQVGSVAGVPQRSTSQFSLTGQEGAAMRFLANGYLPKTITRTEVIASRQTANLVVRLKRGGELHGVVLDNDGRPVAGARVILAPLDIGVFAYKPFLGWNGPGPGHTYTVTDPAGRFSLRGVGDQPRLIALSSDSRMVKPVAPSQPAQELKITLPKPATLVIRYDIPGGAAEGGVHLTLCTNELEMPLWKDLILDRWEKVPNGGQIVLTNLTPGTYDFSCGWAVSAPNPMYGFMFGDPAGPVQTDHRRLVLESGRTQQVNAVRSVGQRVQGQVTGLDAITHKGGPFPFLYVGSATAINSPLDFKAKLFEPCFDAVQVGKDGQFQTALLEPGVYTLAVEVYVQCDPVKPAPVGDDEADPEWGDIAYACPARLTCIGSAKVTVIADAAPTPVKIELRPWVDPAKVP